MRWNDAIVRVCVGDDANGWNNGTGFYVDRGLLLTAHHVITDADGADPLICIEENAGFQNEVTDALKPGPENHGPCGEGFVQAQLVWSSNEFDVALLSCDPGREHTLRLAASRHPVLTEVVSGGFPEGAKIDKEREYFPVSGSAHTPRSAENFFQYDLNTDARCSTDWGGMSGAPVFDEKTQRVLGIVVRAREAMQKSGYLEVVPAAEVVRAEGFAQHFGDWRAHELPPAFREIFLGKVMDRLDLALSVLTIDEQDDLSTLIRRVNCDFDGAVSASTLFEFANEVVIEIGRTQSERHRTDPDSAQQFGLIGQLLCYDDMSDDHLRLISYVGSKRNDATVDPFSCLAHTLTLLEMLAAATDGLDPTLPSQRDPARLPRSDWILPFAVRETGAADPDGESDSIAHLARKTGIELATKDKVDKRVDSFFRNEGLLYPEERDPANWDFVSVAEELSIRLAAAKARGERSYVLPAIRPEDTESAMALKASLQRLKEMVPELLIMGLVLDERGALSEERDLQPLLNTIPVENTRRRRRIDDQN